MKWLICSKFIRRNPREFIYKSNDFRTAHTTHVSTFEEFKEAIENKGGFVSAHWDGTDETEDQIKELTKATIRCIPNDAKEEVELAFLQGNLLKKSSFCEGILSFLNFLKKRL